MIKIILVDSDPISLDRARRIIEGSCEEVAIIAKCRDAISAKEKIAFLEPDLVIMEVSMPDKSGFDLLDELENKAFEVIFVTENNHNSLQAFRYSAVDYLMKPVDELLLINAVERAGKRISAAKLNTHLSGYLHHLKKVQVAEEMKLCVPSLKGFQVISLNDIMYCEAETSYTIFHLASGQQIVASRPIIEYETILQNTSFCRVHKSFMINMTHVKEYQRGEGGTVILSNKSEVEVSRRKKEVFMNKLKVLYRQ